MDNCLLNAEAWPYYAYYSLCSIHSPFDLLERRGAGPTAAGQEGGAGRHADEEDDREWGRKRTNRCRVKRESGLHIYDWINAAFEGHVLNFRWQEGWDISFQPKHTIIKN